MPDCRNCGAPLRIIRDKGLFVCEHCGSEHEAPPIPEGLEFLGETSQACPICSTPLWKSRLHSQPLLCCPTCAGLLIGMNVFTTIIDAMRSHQPGSRTYQAMTAVVFYAGLRPSEVVMLRPRALHLPTDGWGSCCPAWAPSRRRSSRAPFWCGKGWRSRLVRVRALPDSAARLRE